MASQIGSHSVEVSIELVCTHNYNYTTAMLPALH